MLGMLMLLGIGIILMALGFYWLRKIYLKNRKEFSDKVWKKTSTFLSLTAFLMDISTPMTLKNFAGVLFMFGVVVTVSGLWALIHYLLRFE